MRGRPGEGGFDGAEGEAERRGGEHFCILILLFYFILLLLNQYTILALSIVVWLSYGSSFLFSIWRVKYGTFGGFGFR